VAGASVVLGLAGAVGLGADAVVAGVDRASGLAGVVAGFCELAAFVLGVTGWVARRRTALSSADGRGDDAAGSGSDEVGPGAGAEAAARAKYAVDVREARGLQIGDHNIQQNEFRGVPPACGQGGGEHGC
jgi:hypothetical protein